MTISRPRRRVKKLRREGTKKKRGQKKDWTKKKIKEITEVVQTMTEKEFDALPESLSEILKYLRKYG
jgi:ribosomal protein S25